MELVKDDKHQPETMATRFTAVFEDGKEETVDYQHDENITLVEALVMASIRMERANSIPKRFVLEGLGCCPTSMLPSHPEIGNLPQLAGSGEDITDQGEVGHA